MRHLNKSFWLNYKQMGFLLGTDINGAVLKGVDMLREDRKAKRLPEKSIDMIILLTDGDPTSGESVTDIIMIQLYYTILLMHLRFSTFSC